MLFLKKRESALTFFLVGLAFLFSTPARAYQEVEVKNGGGVSGQVSFEGSIPEIPAIAVVKNPEFCGDQVRDPVLTVHPADRGLKNVVVFLEDIKKGKALPKGTAIDAFKCLFVPYTTVVFKGRPVLFHNNDIVFHNAHVLTKKGRTVMNVALPEFGSRVVKTIKKEGIYRIECDSHLHMNGWAVALDHPYYAVTDERGRFSITGIPPGEYRLVAWHPGYRMTNEEAYRASLKSEQVVRPLYDSPHRQSVSVTVKGGEKTDLNFSFPEG